MSELQEIVASGFPWAASQRATTTSEEPACTGTGAAEFLGLAEGERESERGHEGEFHFDIFVHQAVNAFELEGLRQRYTNYTAGQSGCFIYIYIYLDNIKYIQFHV